MADRAFAWQVEEACLNAWPCPRQVLRGRWLIRAAGGTSRRQNSVNPLPSHRYDPAAVMAEAGATYAALGRPLVFRVPGLAEGLADALAGLGFRPQHRTRTLLRPLAATDRDEADPAVLVTAAPSEPWLALRRQLNGGSAEADRVVRAVVKALVLPAAFAEARRDDQVAAIAYGAIDRDLLVIEAVGTDPSLRGQGHARRAVAALMAWAHRRGATGACLQVLAANAPALALYGRLGFATDLYPYDYFARETLP